MTEIPELQVLFHRFGIALALGLFIGVEREMEKSGYFCRNPHVPAYQNARLPCRNA